MKDFLLIFRNTASSNAIPPSAEQMQSMMKTWQDWIGNIAAQNKLTSSGNRLETEGVVIKPNNIITNGPYVEIKEAIGGYIVVKAESLAEATELSKDCPILQVGGNVEIRAIIPMQ